MEGIVKKLSSKVIAAALAVAMVAGLTACGSSAASATGSAAGASEAAGSAESGSAGAGASGTAATGENIVNIGVTSTLSSINPLNIDVSFMALYAQSMMFLPLGALDENYAFEGLLADSVTTDDNITFTVKLADIKWSDGEPVTAQDVVWTMLKISSPEVANSSFDFSVFKGFDENGQSPSGATQIEGIKATDDKTVVFTAVNPMSIASFENNFCTWVPILPSHVLSSTADADLATSEWFNKPTVIDGSYFLDEYDAAHYISYHANKDYSLGAPKIDKLNFKVVDSAGLLAGLKSGEIDFVQPAIGIIPNADLSSVEALDNVTTTYSDPVMNQMTFINTSRITDSRVRQAIVYAIDRQTLVDGLLSGHGEVGEGFISSASPYYDSSIKGFDYNPDKAKELLSEAGWDSSKELEYYVWSGDDAMVKGSQVIQQYLSTVGISVNIHTVDMDTLMSVAGTDDVDMFSVQYTVTPNEYYVDAQYLVDMETTSWTGGYFDEDVDAALTKTQTATDDSEVKAAYKTLQEKMIEDVPMFSMYFISNAQVVSTRLQNATPSLYGAFNHVEKWEIK